MRFARACMIFLTSYYADLRVIGDSPEKICSVLFCSAHSVVLPSLPPSLPQPNEHSEHNAFRGVIPRRKEGRKEGRDGLIAEPHALNLGGLSVCPRARAG